jgi:hypothetical protein
MVDNRDNWLTAFLTFLVLGMFVGPIFVSIVPNSEMFLKPIVLFAFLFSPYAIFENNKLRRIFIFFSLFTFIYCIASLFSISFFQKTSALGLLLIFLILLSVFVLKQVLRDGDITMHRVKGAVAFYLLIGLIFQQCYVLSEITSPGSFFMPAAKDVDDLESILQHFSFITLTTVGYGNIAPLSSLARTLSNMEAIIGQLYPAVFIASLIARAK